MKLFALALFYKGPAAACFLTGSFDLQSFSFFQRNSVRQFMVFTGKLIVERSGIPTRATVREQDYMCHVYVRSDSLSGLAVTDADYPGKVAHNLLSRLLNDFSSQFSSSVWKVQSEAQTQSIDFPALSEYLRRYQDPKTADAMTRVQEELDETKVILHNTIQAVLERGEKLDDLVERSEGLNAQSKMFYRQARRMNRCCTWL
ncbi:synaptobrevin YKT6 [Trichuris trichiura]|uniref:Synaptobrevin YKT6 n=1 Tax=Trichuris trichiura TaxID=36087 RepID=A0A077ZGW7_TRITR|nr:synaptobrevin YKT6 [Trichuris trichiura]